jgi:hypothetical protein
VLLDALGRSGQLDWSRAEAEQPEPARQVGERTGPNPTDRGGRLAVTVARLPDLDPVMIDDRDGRGAAV